ncbi:hypothetical protein R6Z07M_001994 [Ovis aries]
MSARPFPSADRPWDRPPPRAPAPGAGGPPRDPRPGPQGLLRLRSGRPRPAAPRPPGAPPAAAAPGLARPPGAAVPGPARGASAAHLHPGTHSRAPLPRRLCPWPGLQPRRSPQTRLTPASPLPSEPGGAAPVAKGGPLAGTCPHGRRTRGQSSLCPPRDCGLPETPAALASVSYPALSHRDATRPAPSSGLGPAPTPTPAGALFPHQSPKRPERGLPPQLYSGEKDDKEQALRNVSEQTDANLVSTAEQQLGQSQAEGHGGKDHKAPFPEHRTSQEAGARVPRKGSWRPAGRSESRDRLLGRASALEEGTAGSEPRAQKQREVKGCAGSRAHFRSAGSDSARQSSLRALFHPRLIKTGVKSQ